MHDASPNEWQTVAQVARRCGVSRFAVRRWLTIGVRGVRLAGTMMGGTWRVRSPDLDAFLAELTRRATPAAPNAPARGATPAAIRARVNAATERLRKKGVIR